MPVEPPWSPWQFPSPFDADEEGDGLVCIGGDLEPGTVLAAYRGGLFPMPVGEGTMGWWSPDPRGLLPLDGLQVSRSLRRSTRRYRVTVDAAFREVVERCGDPSRSGGWITPEITDAYTTMHGLGWAHSVETWLGDDLVGGLYGVAIGGLFAGESMFSVATDASKVALVELVGRLRAGGGVLLDVQWRTEHLASLGVIDVPRRDYFTLLRDAIAAPQLFLSP